MAETENKMTVPGPSGIAMTAKQKPTEADIYSVEMLKELEKREKAVRAAINGMEKNFEKAAFNLYWIYQTGMYKTMGYDSITDYAAQTFDFSKSTTYGFISVAERFGKRSMDGKVRECIDDKYKAYSPSKLSAMTNLEDEEIESSGITPEMSVREIKKAVKRTLGSAAVQINTGNEPSDADITAFYERTAFEFDGDRNRFAELLKEFKGKSYSGVHSQEYDYSCTPRGVSINDSEEITWNQYVKRLNGLIPAQPAPEPASGSPDLDSDSETIPPTDSWIPCEISLPLKPNKISPYLMVLVTLEEGYVTIETFKFDTMKFYDSEDEEISVTAWQPLPEPYRQKGGN